MIKLWNTIGITKKMIIIYLLVIILMILVPYSVLKQKYVNDIQDYLFNILEGSLKENEATVSDLLNTVDIVVNQINNNESAVIIENENDWRLSSIGEAIVRYDPDKDDIRLHEALAKIQQSELEISSLFETTSRKLDGNCFCALIVNEDHAIEKHLKRFEYKSNNKLFRSENLKQTKWYQHVVNMDGEYYWFTQEEYPNRVFLAKKLSYHRLKDMNNYKKMQLGVVLLDFDFSELVKKFEITNVLENIQFVFCSTEGIILYNNRPFVNAVDDEGIREMIQSLSIGSTMQYEYDGQRYLIQANSVGMSMIMYSIVPLSNVYRITNHTNNLIIILMFISSVIGSLIFYILSLHFVKPIKRLDLQLRQNYMEQIEIDSNRNDEIGCLYQKYNQMTREIQKKIRNIWVQSEARKNAEMRALQAQMNPHFIYNTLGAISCNALMCGQDNMANQITDLAEIIRYNIREPNVLVSLKDEVEIVKKYEKIWKMSYNDKLTFSYDIAPECEEFRIPKLLIQPLVENAIVHGVDLDKERGKIRIHAKSLNIGCMIIKVANNRKDIDANRINQYLQNNYEIERSESIGIKSICAKVGRYFGEESNLYYQKNENDEIEAVLILRLKEDKTARSESGDSDEK